MSAQPSFSIFSTEITTFFTDEASLLSAHYPGLSCERLFQEVEQLGIDTLESLEEWQVKLRQGIPLEYISGRAYFYKSEFTVSDAVLIPRSETEILIEMAATFLKKQIGPCSIVDIGTGSGAIAISLMQEVDTPHSFILSDISESAIEIAKCNLRDLSYRYSCDHSVKFIQSDRFENIDSTFDLIISNPPYIKKDADIAGVHAQVAKFEPDVALFLADDVYEQWFHDFFTESLDHLNSAGMFIMEGHEDHLQKQSEILKYIGFINVKVINDFTNRPRFIQAIKG